METVVHLFWVFFPFLFLGGCVVWHGYQVRKSLTTGDGRPIAQVFWDVMREARRAHDPSVP
jgi:hypothetical protein